MQLDIERQKDRARQTSVDESKTADIYRERGVHIERDR